MNDKNVSMQEELNADFWNQRYLTQDTRWDLGACSPPLKAYFDQLENKAISVLIPGAGNAYEGKYLNQLGFQSITILDIAHTVVERLKEELSDQPSIRIIESDFFKQDGQYDLIIEQTFFCALDPQLRNDYVKHMHDLLKPEGKLVGLLFNKDFNQPFPPFGGSEVEYRSLFSPWFTIDIMEACYNSHPARQGNELFIQLVKK
jgi:SAM-dependent methyltransferase